MTDTSHRLYAVVIAVVVFFVSWAAVAAKPWATHEARPPACGLAQREQRLRADAKLVQQVVDRRMAAYQLALKARKRTDRGGQGTGRGDAGSLAARRSNVGPPSTAPAVRVVNLPPLTITRTS